MHLADFDFNLPRGLIAEAEAEWLAAETAIEQFEAQR